MGRPTFLSLNSCLNSWRARRSAPVDPYGLAVFRMVFGLIMAWEAWRMLRGGWGVVDPENYLTPRQVEEISSRPEMIRQFAQHIGEWAAAGGCGGAVVHAGFHAGLNGRPLRGLTGPGVDRTRSPRPVWGRADWVLPFTVPQRAGGDEAAARP